MNSKTAAWTLAVPLFGAAIAGCGTTASSASPTTVATVNGASVTSNDVNIFVKGTEFIQGMTLPNTKTEKSLEVKAVVAQVTVNQWALKHHLITEKQAQAKANQFITANIESQVGGKTGLVTLLKSHQLTFGELQTYITDEMIGQSAFNKVTKNVKSPTTTQEQAYYTANKASFSNPPEDEISDILVKSQSLANTILKDAKAGQSFATLAKQYSISSTGKTGGSLGYLPVGTTSMSQGMATAVQNLKAGQYATYHGTKGYHVIWLQAVKASTVQPFSAVQAQIKQQLLQNSADALYQSWTQKLEKAQKITIK